MEFVPKDWYFRGRGKPQSDPTAINRQYSQPDVITDHDFFTRFAAQDQHVSRSSKKQGGRRGGEVYSTSSGRPKPVFLQGLLADVPCLLTLTKWCSSEDDRSQGLKKGAR